MTGAACSCCAAPAVVRSKTGRGRWCRSCVDACNAVRRSLRKRLGHALANGAEPDARVTQEAFLLLLRGLHGAPASAAPTESPSSRGCQPGGAGARAVNPTAATGTGTDDDLNELGWLIAEIAVVLNERDMPAPFEVDDLHRFYRDLLKRSGVAVALADAKARHELQMRGVVSPLRRLT